LDIAPDANLIVVDDVPWEERKQAGQEVTDTVFASFVSGVNAITNNGIPVVAKITFNLKTHAVLSKQDGRAK